MTEREREAMSEMGWMEGGIGGENKTAFCGIELLSGAQTIPARETYSRSDL